MEKLLENTTAFVKNNISIETVLVFGIILFNVTMIDWYFSKRHRPNLTNNKN